MATTIATSHSSAEAGVPAAVSDRMTLRGGRPLHGEVAVRGAKNFVPKAMVAALLTGQPCVLRNVARIQDVDVVSEMFEALGGRVSAQADGTLELDSAELRPIDPVRMAEFAGKSRIPVLLCGPLLARLGEVTIPGLGGCDIGSRPIDFHLRALAELGAEVHETADAIRLRAPRRLTGTTLRLDYPSVGATEQVLLSAVLADGITHLDNAAIEPEIIDLIALLQKMGAEISVETDRAITVTGVRELGGYDHRAGTDRLEVASWACAAVATGGRVTVRGARQLDMMTFLNRLRQLGGAFEITDDAITFWRAGDSLRPVALETDVHPGFMTDWQQPFVVALTQADGVSVVHETVYENRLGYIGALNEMGARIQLHRECLGGRACRFGQRNHLHSAVIVGPTRLRGHDIHIPDLRGGFSYIVAALAAEGESRIDNMRLIQRGYEDFEAKLRALGAEIVTP